MKTTTSVVLTGGIVAVGQWIQDKQITFKIIVGVGITALFLAVIAESNAEFAEGLGTLILVGAIFAYAPDIVKTLGF